MANQFDEEDKKWEQEKANLLKMLDANKPYVKFHKNAFDSRCTVCALGAKPEILEVFKATYIKGWTSKQLKREFPGTKPSDIRGHAHANGWDYERAKSTEVSLAVMHSVGLKFVKNNPDSVDGELLLKTIQHIDKREGRIIDKTEVNNNVAIVFTQQPLAISPAKNALPEVTGGTKSLALAPVNVEVLDAETSEAQIVQPNGHGDDVPADAGERNAGTDT